jgi:hypothetical protein
MYKKINSNKIYWKKFMENETLVKELWASDQASSLTNRAAREIERLNEEVKAAPHAAVAAIAFALEDDGCEEFLRCWNEGDFDAIRREWPEAPEEVFIGADPLHVSNEKVKG